MKDGFKQKENIWADHQIELLRNTGPESGRERERERGREREEEEEKVRIKLDFCTF
jgi:hypothetical protein